MSKSAVEHNDPNFPKDLNIYANLSAGTGEAQTAWIKDFGIAGRTW